MGQGREPAVSMASAEGVKLGKGAVVFTSLLHTDDHMNRQTKTNLKQCTGGDNWIRALLFPKGQKIDILLQEDPAH